MPDANDAPASAESLAQRNAERALFHRSLAAQQTAELVELLSAPCALPAPLAADARDDWRGAALADALAAFTRAHGALLGTRPFLRGWRAWLEAQRGLETPLVWRLRPEALTQAGGPAWTRDAVALLRGHAVRRPQLELEGQRELPEWLVWALPDGFGDDDVRTALGALPPDAALEDVNATGELANDTSPAAAPRSRVALRGVKAQRLCCCFGPALLSSCPERSRHNDRVALAAARHAGMKSEATRWQQ